MPESNFVDIDKRIAALQGQIGRIKRVPLFSKAPLVEKAVEDLLELLALMVVELKTRKPVYCDADVFVYCGCGLEIRTNFENPLAKCPGCDRSLEVSPVATR